MTRDHAIAILLAHENELRSAGVRSLRLFGSVARDEAGPESDIDIEAAFENSSELTLLDLVRLERHLSGLLGRKVELVQQGSFKDDVRQRVEAEAVLAF
jgi:predicted nucleotidyltransferase